MTTETNVELIGFKTRFSIAKLIQEIGSLPVSIVDNRNDHNGPFRRLEQPRDVMVSDARGGYCWTWSSSRSVCTHASDVLVIYRGRWNDGVQREPYGLRGNLHDTRKSIAADCR